jgi:hypothetical protein
MPQARVRSNWAGRSSANTERYRTKASNEGNDDQPRDLWDGMLMTSRSQGNAHMEPDLAFYFSTDQILEVDIRYYRSTALILLEKI